jgi:hypothetical protein
LAKELGKNPLAFRLELSHGARNKSDRDLHHSGKRPPSCANRIVIAPMCRYSVVDGCMTDWHLVHLGHLALTANLGRSGEF